MTPPPLAIRADGGLANKLRVLLSYRLVAMDEGRPLVCLWKRSEHCRARFGDLFEALDGVAVLESEGDESDVQPALGRWGVEPPPTGGANVSGSIHVHPSIAGTDREASMYLPLKPRPALQAAIAATIASCGGAGAYVSVHLRRTDWADLFGVSTPDEEFTRFVARTPPQRPCYVATDNAATQRLLLDALGARGRSYAPVDEAPTDLRHTSVFHAAVDLYTAAAAATFKGSRGSSFSEAIWMLRRTHGRASDRDELDTHRQRRRRQWRAARAARKSGGC